MNAGEHLKLAHTFTRVLVGDRFVEVDSTYGFRWGTVVGVEKAPYNNYYRVHMDGTPAGEVELFLYESVFVEKDFESVLDVARRQYGRWEFDYRHAIEESRKVAVDYYREGKPLPSFAI